MLGVQGLGVGLGKAKQAACSGCFCPGSLYHKFYLNAGVCGDDPKGSCKPSQHTKGGEYSDETVVLP